MTTPKSFTFVYRLTSLAVVVFGAALAMILASPQKARADICTINGRDCYIGYFTNVFDGGPGVTQHNVMSAPALLNVHNAGQLVGTLWGHLGGCPGGGLWNQNDQNAVGAAFIIVTMMRGPAGAGLPKNTACADFGRWSAMVYNLEASGHINFNQVYDFGGINTRSTNLDVSYYPKAGAAPSIVFYNPANGAPIYAIKKDCANPIGRLQAIRLNYDLQPSVTATVNGAAVTGPVEAGDQVTFVYRVRNNGNTNSEGTICNAAAINHAGYFPTPGAPEGGGAPVGLSCSPPQPPQVFPRNSTTQVGGPETITAVANTTHCRTLFVRPATMAGNTRGTEICVTVASKPYLKVYGGDVSVGGGLETAPDTCTNNAEAAVVSWNKLPAGGFAGAGAQYAVQAVKGITEFASAQGNSGGAPVPTGLSFANTWTNVPANNYGGYYGGVKCITNYYGQKPASGVQPFASLASGTGTYESIGNTTFSGGTLNPGDRWTIYVDGDLFIAGDIRFGGSWQPNDMPFLKVVVRGNIYISGPGVTQLDGVYIAQPNGAGVGGTIYTCATGFAPPNLANGAFYNSCTNKLTVNGAFIARSVEFGRTRGSLRQSTPAEASGSNNIAEVFNYGPAFWIVQPPGSNGQEDKYDSITSLPPVL